MNEEGIKKELLKEGYDNVYVWDAEPLEDDPDHTHSFDTRIVILSGDIEIGIDGKKILLKSEQTIDIPRNKVHSGLVGKSGCKYIVAEKH